MIIKKIRNGAILLALLAGVSLASYKVGQNNAVYKPVDSSGNLNLSLMWRVKDELNKMFLEKDKISDEKMVYGAIQGMVSSLEDPYTVFLPPKENKSSNEDLAGEFGGVGIELGYSKDKILNVIAPLAKTPADKAGIKSGDLILKIIDKNKNIDKDTSGIALNEAVELIRGKVGSEVTLRMFREGAKEPYDVNLKRESIVVPSIELEWVDSAKALATEKGKENKKIAWVRLYKFTERLFTEWPDMVNQINLEKSKGNFGGVVLDLRNNPGGYLQASVMVASDFIKDGVVVKQESSDGKVETYNVDKSRGKLLGDGLVVLVNGGSASASEILAGAIRDHERAKLVGEKTFGKGTVQQPETFKDGSGLHVTVARWLLPSGKNIHKEGVNPDVEVKDVLETEDDEQLNKAIETLVKS